jgi:hypothetical protein
VPSVWGTVSTLLDLWQRRPVHLYTCLYLVNAAILAFVPFSTYREFLGILRFIVGMVLSHLLYTALRYPNRRPLVYSTLWLVLLGFLISG